MEPGETVLELGVRYDGFYYVLEGKLIAVDPSTGERYGTGHLGPTQFAGEINFINDRRVMFGVRAGSIKRVASAVGEGSVVISEVWSYLNEGA